MRIGNTQINTNPCTQAEQNQNWGVVQYIFNNLTEFLSGAGSSDHKVSTNAANDAAVGFDYLNAQIAGSGTSIFVSGQSCPVRSDDAGDGPVQLFWDITDITDYSLTGNRVLTTIDGVLVWGEYSATVDSFTTKITGTDSVPGFFHDCVEDTDTIVSGTDLIVVGNVVGGSGTDQTERFAVDVSAIASYHATEFRVLGIEGGTSAYKTVTQVGVQLVADTTFVDWLNNNLDFAGGGGGSASCKIGKADADIDYRIGTQAKSGTVSIWTMNGSGVLSDTGDNETWWNISSTGNIRAGDFLMATLDETSGKWIITFEDCTFSDL